MTDDDVQGPAFGRFRLVGGRYDRPGLPVATAVELHRYERLVIAVARALYFREHPRRKRAPRGFDGALDLRIIGVVKAESVVPTMVRGLLAESLLPVDYHERARRLINEALGSVNDGGSLPTDFPLEAVAEFASFGRSLAEDESIDLAAAGESSAVLTQDTRRRVQALASSNELEVEVTVQGQLTGLRSSSHQFEFQLHGGRRIDGTYVDADIWKELHQFEGYRDRAPLVALAVVARQTLNGELLAITDVLAIEAALPTEWADRIAELGALEVGWLLNETEPPTRESLDFTEELLLACVDDGVTRPSIYPSADGGVQLEWKLPHRALEIEIANDRTTRFFALDLDGDDDLEESTGRDIDQLLDLVQAHL